MIDVFLGLGSNLGNKKDNIMTCISRLEAHPECSEITCSDIVETVAITKDEQPNYLNAVVRLFTTLSPKELLEEIQKIEVEMGRKNKGTYQPRTIDIDILFYGDEVICEEGLTIPHPLVHERGFVLTPLTQLAPDFVHPILQQTIEELCTPKVGY